MSFIKFVYVVFCFIVTNLSMTVYASTPLNIRVSNARGTQFTVSWVSSINEIGYIRYGTSIENYENWKIVDDERGKNIEDDIHYITVKNIYKTIIYYEIISGDTIDNNNNRYYNIYPGPVLDPIGGSCLPAGKIYKDEGKTQLAYDSIVYIKILGESGNENSSVESVLISSNTNGYWYIELLNFRNQDYNSYYNFECAKSHILIEAQGGADGSAYKIVKATDYRESESPEVVLKKDSTPIGFTSDVIGIVRNDDNGLSHLESQTDNLKIYLTEYGIFG